MSEVEEAAKSCLAPLILGETLMIEETSQRLISKWIALKAMIVSFDAVARQSAIPEGVRLFESEFSPFLARTVSDFFRPSSF